MIEPSEFERPPDPLVGLPASELLHDPQLAASTWPEQSTDPSFGEQIAQRQEALAAFDDIHQAVPRLTMSLEVAVEHGQVSEAQVARLYDSLSGLLADPDSGRLLLYLPFECLPSTDWMPEAQHLQDAIDTFRQNYWVAWSRLLHVHDARANFVDGDVLEPDLREGDLPRVVKATHLLPLLVEHGMLQTSNVVSLLARDEDELALSNIADTLLVLHGRGMMTTEAYDRLWELAGTGTVFDARVLESESPIEPPGAPPTVASIRASVEALANDPGPAVTGPATERRQAWLQQRHAAEAVAATATQVKQLVLRDPLKLAEVQAALLAEQDGLGPRVFIAGMQAALEHAAQNSGELNPHLLYQEVRPALAALWEHGDPELRNHLTATYRRLHKLDVVRHEQLTELEVPIPTLTGPFSENLAHMPDEAAHLKRVTAQLESHPELASLLYPVVTVGGSRLKGYGEPGSDLDVCVFVRPGTPEDQKATIREQLGPLLGTAEQPAEAHEIWLDDQDGRLQVRDFPDYDSRRADSFWTHKLFTTAWIGAPDAVAELRRQLLPAYFYDTSQEPHGHDPRPFYLERLEQDVLQYRLMHKGYERHYPRVNSLDSPHAERLDGQSVFWDSGYRWLASRLFISNVFLPKLAAREQ